MRDVVPKRSINYSQETHLIVVNLFLKNSLSKFTPYKTTV